MRSFNGSLAFSLCLSCSLGWLASTALAQGAGEASSESQRVQPAQQDNTGQQDRTEIYGHNLMTPAERAEYRATMQLLHEPKEREAYQLEHQRLIRERARERDNMERQ